MKDIHRVYISHTINSVALSVIGIYVPAYLLTLGYSLPRVILFFIVLHGIGVLIGLFIFVPLMQRVGLITLYKLYFPLKILYLILLFCLEKQPIPIELIAIIGGAATFAYYIPQNLLFIKHSSREDMGKNFARLFALPKFFSIVGPLVAAVLIPITGFWPVFIIAVTGMIISYIPLASLHDAHVTVSLHFSTAWQRLKRHKLLFILEGFDNVIEESEWFWGIYVFLLVGSLATPGIIGSLEAVGGALFALLVGKYAHTYAKHIIPIASLLLLVVTFARIFVATPVLAYGITVVSSFLMTLFMVAYFSTIYRNVKGESEEEFIILREIPTVLGRMVVFATVLLPLSDLRFFFLTPIICIFLLLGIYLIKGHTLAVD